ncbi:MAG: hypothetical protein WCF84_18605 [Anaerolineae bacterium]
MSENQQESVSQQEPVVVESRAMEPVAAPVRPPEPGLSEEFREFGRQLSALLHVVRESPRAKEIEAQVAQTMREMEHEVTEAMKTARQRVQEQSLKETIKGAAQTAADETQRGLVRGMRLVNEQMAHLVQETEKGLTPKPKGKIIEIEVEQTAAPATSPASGAAPSDTSGETLR